MILYGPQKKPNGDIYMKKEKFSIAEISRIYNVPVHLLKRIKYVSIGYTYNKICNLFVKTIINPWLKRYLKEYLYDRSIKISRFVR